MHALDFIIPPPLAVTCFVSLELALNRWRMLSHRLDEDPFRFDFTDEFLAEFGFSTAGGVATMTGGPGDDDCDVDAQLFSFGSLPPRRGHGDCHPLLLR